MYVGKLCPPLPQLLHVEVRALISMVPSNIKFFYSTIGATNSATNNHKALRTEEEGAELCGATQGQSEAGKH